MEFKIYFEKSGENSGPFSINYVIEKLVTGEIFLSDSTFCSKVSEVWIPLKKVLIGLFSEVEDLQIFLSPGDGTISGTFSFESCLKKIESEEDFWEKYLAYDKQSEHWVSFQDFVLNRLLLIDGYDDENEEPQEEGDVENDLEIPSKSSETAQEVAPSEILILNKMIADSVEFKQLSCNLSGFNLWDLFHINTLEVQNERMLLWLLKESKSHNLGDLFLRRWLILILHNDRLNKNMVQRSLNPLNIEYARVVESKIISQKKIFINGRNRRLDLFIDLKTFRQDDWVIIIEIKVETFDSENQLKDYRQWLNEKYPNHKKLTIFLYDDNCSQSLPVEEEPHWLKTTFSDVRKVLKEALQEKKGLIPLREKSFIEQYLENLPPLAPAGKSENLDDLTHTIFGNYSIGIQYAIDSNNQGIDNLNSWQRHARNFVRERTKEFSLLEKQTQQLFLTRELSTTLLYEDWFPNSPQIENLIVFNQNDPGIELVSLMMNNYSNWKDSIPSNHLSVYIHLFLGTYQGHSRFRLRIKVPAQSNLDDKRNQLIQDFFGQRNPSNYGGNKFLNQNTGLIYNKVLDYEKNDNLFILCRSIIQSFKEIWSEDDNFSMALDAILENVRD